MTLEDLANIGEFVGGIGVIVTLIYLALQIRHNTTAQRNSSRFGATQSMTQWYLTVMADEELVAIFSKGFLEPDRLEASERARFMWMLAALSSRVEEMYAQYEAGLIPGDLWFKFRGVIASVVEEGVGRDWWQSRITPLSDRFRAAIEATPDSEKTWDPSKMQVLTESLDGSTT